MEAAVTTVLADSSAYSVGRVWRPANSAGLQTEPEDRTSGRRRSPQQSESLAAAGDWQCQCYWRTARRPGITSVITLENQVGIVITLWGDSGAVFWCGMHGTKAE